MMKLIDMLVRELTEWKKRCRWRRIQQQGRGVLFLSWESSGKG